MALDTSLDLRNQLIYSVYVRNHTEEGTFKKLQEDLDRIKALGTDIIWLMPIHPIGVKGKKGSLGCPYSISDYRGINPAYGSMEDFIHLVNAIHAKGMKCMIDVVYNHSSQDSILLAEHPEYFYRKDNGDFGNRCGDWEDVYDLDYENRDLWRYQIDSLKFWAGYVDGFRCDVASCVPAAFWVLARAEVKKVRPDCIWLAESVHYQFVNFFHSMGYPIATDCELYEAFDIEYQYDLISHFEDYLNGNGSLKEWMDALEHQEATYPVNYIKLRYLENHDMQRICSRVSDPNQLQHLLAFTFFQKGTALIYAGQEYCNRVTPSLFEIDPIDRSGRDISELITRLAAFKKRLPTRASFEVKFVEDVVFAAYRFQGLRAFGVFRLKGEREEIEIPVEDGIYENAFNGQKLQVANQRIVLGTDPVLVCLE